MAQLSKGWAGDPPPGTLSTLGHPPALAVFPRPTERGGEGAGEAEQKREVEVAPSLQGEQEAPRRRQVTALRWQLPHPCCPPHRSKDIATAVEGGVPFSALHARTRGRVRCLRLGFGLLEDKFKDFCLNKNFSDQWETAHLQSGIAKVQHLRTSK